ncbi:MAG: hypothetical protein ACT4PQ_06725 [Betaproteobacteria bacterium]
MRMRTLLLLTGIAVVAAAPGFAKDAQTPAGNSTTAQPGSGVQQITAPAVPGAAKAKEEVAGQPAETKKQRIRYTFPPAAAKRM